MEKNNLQPPLSKNEILDKTEKPHSSTTPLWGKMDLECMIAHNSTALEVVCGKRMRSWGFYKYLFAKAYKKTYIRPRI
jgi:hypothetical protein